MPLISAQTAATVLADTDLIEVVDVSDTTMAATGTNKKMPLSLLRSYVGTQVFNVKSAEFGAIGDGSANDTTAVQAAIDAAKTAGWGGIVFFPPGRYMCNTLTIQPADTNHRVLLVGSGYGCTDIFARTGQSDALIKIISPDGTSSQTAIGICGMRLYMAAFAFPCINMDRVASSIFKDLVLLNGTYGIYATRVGGTKFEHLIIENQTTCGFYLNGESSGENFYTDISINASDGTTTMVNGFRIERTTATDFGGHYLFGVRVVETSTNVISGPGFLFDSSVAYTFVGVTMVDCVADSITGAGAKFLNATDCRITNTWFNANPAYAVILDGCRKLQFTGCDISSPTGGIQFLGTTTNVNIDIIINGCVIPGGIGFNMPASNQPTACWYAGNNLYGTTAISNDLVAYANSRLAAGASDFGTTSIYSLTATATQTAAAENSLKGTGVGSMTVKANNFIVGRAFRLKANGTWTTAATPGTWNFKVKIGSVIVSTTGALTATASMTTRPWRLEVVITVRATGSGTTANVFAQGKFEYEPVTPSTATTASTTWQMVNTAVSSGFDSTIDNVLDLTITPSVATGSISCTNLTVQQEM